MPSFRSQVVQLCDFSCLEMLGPRTPRLLSDFNQETTFEHDQEITDANRMALRCDKPRLCLCIGVGRVFRIGLLETPQDEINFLHWQIALCGLAELAGR